MNFSHVCKYYQMGDTTVKAADHISFQIQKGEFVAIVGQSGSRKIHLHEHHRLSGRAHLRRRICWTDRTWARWNRNQLAEIRNKMLGFIFQQYNLLPKLNLLENVEVPLMYAGVPKAERRERAEAGAGAGGPGGQAAATSPTSSPAASSSGCPSPGPWRADPAVILADEPTGALDSHTGREVLDMLQKLHDAGNTVVLITHDNSIAVQAQRIIRLEDGHVIYDGDAHDPGGRGDPRT